MASINFGRLFCIALILLSSSGCHGRSVVEEHQLHRQDQAIHKQHVVSGDKRPLHYPKVKLGSSLKQSPGGPDPIHHGGQGDGNGDGGVEHQLHYQNQAMPKRRPLSGDKRLLHYPKVELGSSLKQSPGGPDPIHHGGQGDGNGSGGVAHQLHYQNQAMPKRHPLSGDKRLLHYPKVELGSSLKQSPGGPDPIHHGGQGDGNGGGGVEHQLHYQDQAMHKRHPLSGDKRLLHYPNVALDSSLIQTPGGPNPIHDSG